MARTVRFSELGGPEVLRAPEAPDPSPGPGEVVVVADAVAGPGVAELARATARGGTVTVHGLLSGQPTVFPAETLPEPGMRTYTLSAMTHDEDRLRRAAASVGAGLRAGEFVPRVDRVFDGLDAVVDAHTYLGSDAQVGEIVMTP